MTDTPSSILLTREQSVGSNVNLWGGYLIVTQRQTEQAVKGYQSLAVTGDAVISWTNYATGNIGQCAHLALSGSLTSPAALTFPSLQNFMIVNNRTGATVTVKCSGGTGVAVPNNRRVIVHCNGTDYFCDTPMWTSESLTLTNPGDLVTNMQMATAIATAGLPATAGTVLNSVTDTTAGYLSAKISGVGIAVSTTNPGANEILTLTIDEGQLSLTAGVYGL